MKCVRIFYDSRGTFEEFYVDDSLSSDYENFAFVLADRITDLESNDVVRITCSEV